VESTLGTDTPMKGDITVTSDEIGLSSTLTSPFLTIELRLDSKLLRLEIAASVFNITGEKPYVLHPSRTSLLGRFRYSPFHRCKYKYCVVLFQADKPTTPVLHNHTRRKYHTGGKYDIRINPEKTGTAGHHVGFQLLAPPDQRLVTSN
jgi:hypothetical protein